MPTRFLAAFTCLLLAAPAVAQTSATHDHAHDHAHTHAAPDRSVYDGYFDDAAVADRPLSDWAGEWQSVYPLLTSGTLDPVMDHKAEKGDKTAAGYKAYYDAGYRTDVDRITIDGDRVTFQRQGSASSARYAPDGHEILTYPKGNRGVRFVFRKVEGDAAAPGFIQFSDHKIAPETSDHYHLYWGDDRTALLSELDHWPTYYPAALTPDQIVAEMLAH